jgi:hypothetical protein
MNQASAERDYSTSKTSLDTTVDSAFTTPHLQTQKNKIISVFKHSCGSQLRKISIIIRVSRPLHIRTFMEQAMSFSFICSGRIGIQHAWVKKK